MFVSLLSLRLYLPNKLTKPTLMSPRSFFNIVLKIFGLFFLRELINSIPQMISIFTLLHKGEMAEGILYLIVFILVVGFYFFIISQLFFKTNRIIDKLKLDQGFSEEIFHLKFDKTQLFTVSLIIIGGIMLISEIPNLVRQIITIIQMLKLQPYLEHTDYSYIIVSCAKIIIALLLIGERKRIVAVFENKLGEEEEEVVPPEV